MPKVVVHTFKMGDVEDPQIYAAQPLYEWQLSEQGQWVMENALINPEFFIDKDYAYLGYRVAVVAELDDANATYHMLKWGGNGIRHSQ